MTTPVGRTFCLGDPDTIGDESGALMKDCVCRRLTWPRADVIEWRVCRGLIILYLNNIIIYLKSSWRDKIIHWGLWIYQAVTVTLKHLFPWNDQSVDLSKFMATWRIFPFWWQQDLPLTGHFPRTQLDQHIWSSAEIVDHWVSVRNFHIDSMDQDWWRQGMIWQCPVSKVSPQRFQPRLHVLKPRSPAHRTEKSMWLIPGHSFEPSSKDSCNHENLNINK